MSLYLQHIWQVARSERKHSYSIVTSWQKEHHFFVKLNPKLWFETQSKTLNKDNIHKQNTIIEHKKDLENKFEFYNDPSIFDQTHLNNHNYKVYDFNGIEQPITDQKQRNNDVERKLEELLKQHNDHHFTEYQQSSDKMVLQSDTHKKRSNLSKLRSEKQQGDKLDYNKVRENGNVNLSSQMKLAANKSTKQLAKHQRITKNQYHRDENIVRKVYKVDDRNFQDYYNQQNIVNIGKKSKSRRTKKGTTIPSEKNIQLKTRKMNMLKRQTPHHKDLKLLPKAYSYKNPPKQDHNKIFKRRLPKIKLKNNERTKNKNSDQKSSKRKIDTMRERSQTPEKSVSSKWTQTNTEHQYRSSFEIFLVPFFDPPSQEQTDETKLHSFLDQLEDMFTFMLQCATFLGLFFVLYPLLLKYINFRMRKTCEEIQNAILLKWQLCQSDDYDSILKAELEKIEQTINSTRLMFDLQKNERNSETQVF